MLFEVQALSAQPWPLRVSGNLYEVTGSQQRLPGKALRESWLALSEPVFDVKRKNAANFWPSWTKILDFAL